MCKSNIFLIEDVSTLGEHKYWKYKLSQYP